LLLQDNGKQLSYICATCAVEKPRPRASAKADARHSVPREA